MDNFICGRCSSSRVASDAVCILSVEESRPSGTELAKGGDVPFSSILSTELKVDALERELDERPRGPISCIVTCRGDI